MRQSTHKSAAEYAHEQLEVGDTAALILNREIETEPAYEHFIVKSIVKMDPESKALMARLTLGSFRDDVDDENPVVPGDWKPSLEYRKDFTNGFVSTHALLMHEREEKKITHPPLARATIGHYVASLRRFEDPNLYTGRIMAEVFADNELLGEHLYDNNPVEIEEDEDRFGEYLLGGVCVYDAMYQQATYNFMLSRYVAGSYEIPPGQGLENAN